MLTRFRAVLPALLLLILCPVMVQSVSAQCTQKIATLPAAPELFGFRLGMTKDEIKQLVPPAVFPKADHFGVAKTTINPHFDPKIDQKKYEGVRSISLDLLDDRLVSLWIGFDENYRVQNLDEFMKLMSDSLKINGRWSSWRSRGQQMRCDGFQVIVATLAGGPSLRLLDMSAEDTVAVRRQEKEEQDSLVEAAATTQAAEPTPDIVADKQTKTYYPNGCRPAREITEANRIAFKTAEEAEKAGFKLAKNCH
ncbi:MAG TPA: hypothetical protein VGW58_02560 [Pyrinomonadaceae bacterium]|nr:hypothetical protein [Pyrinomonadaceae bacterium]